MITKERREEIRKLLTSGDSGPFTIDAYDIHADMDPAEVLSLLNTIDEQEKRLELAERLISAVEGQAQHLELCGVFSEGCSCGLDEIETLIAEWRKEE